MADFNQPPLAQSPFYGATAGLEGYYRNQLAEQNQQELLRQSQAKSLQDMWNARMAQERMNTPGLPQRMIQNELDKDRAVIDMNTAQGNMLQGTANKAEMEQLRPILSAIHEIGQTDVGAAATIFNNLYGKLPKHLQQLFTQPSTSQTGPGMPKVTLGYNPELIGGIVRGMGSKEEAAMERLRLQEAGRNERQERQLRSNELIAGLKADLQSALSAGKGQKESLQNYVTRMRSLSKKLQTQGDSLGAAEAAQEAYNAYIMLQGLPAAAGAPTVDPRVAPGVLKPGAAAAGAEAAGTIPGQAPKGTVRKLVRNPKTGQLEFAQ